jgi:hypothetical protein
VPTIGKSTKSFTATNGGQEGIRQEVTISMIIRHGLRLGRQDHTILRIALQQPPPQG